MSRSLDQGIAASGQGTQLEKDGIEPWTIDERGFVLRRPESARSWVNFIGNRQYGMRIGHMGDAYATTLVEPRKVVTNYDFFAPNKGRYVYVRESGRDEEEPVVWCPSFFPAKNQKPDYECIHEPGLTSFTGDLDGLQVVSTHGVPVEGCFELWHIRVRNDSPRRRKITIYPQAEFLLYDSFAVDPVYYSWYTNSRLEDDGKTVGIFKTDASVVYGFFAATDRPVGWESSLTVFRGEKDMQSPEAVLRGRLDGSPSGGDPYIGSFQFDLDLGPGEEWQTAVALGEGHSNLEDFRVRFPDAKAVEEEMDRVRSVWRGRLRRKEFDSLADPVLRNYLQSFMPYQIFQQSQGLVRSTYRGYRDVAQDAMGMSYYDLDASRELILSLLDKQFDYGRCLRQWNTGGGFNDERDFRDLPFWLVLAVGQYLDNGGDPDLLERPGGFYQSEETSSVFDHMVRGIKYGIQFGAHDLLEMGKGDWNDALSGLGPKGESLWLNQIAYLALGILGGLESEHGYASGLDIDELQQRLFNGVQAGWTGSWFLRGYHENGTQLGGDRDGRIFLLPQAWFTISGMAERDPKRASQALDSMVQRCDNAHGLLICDPGFNEYDPVVGNLSALAPGMAENFAVYNHASAFGIYALLKAGRAAEAKKYIDALLPFRKDPQITLAEPFVLVNYYNGGYYPNKAGRGGIPWLTSTVSWLAKGIFDFAFHKQL